MFFAFVAHAAALPDNTELFDGNYNSLSNKDIYLELHWEHMPVIGPILKHSVPLGNFKLRQDGTIPTKREIISEYDYSDIHKHRK